MPVEKYRFILDTNLWINFLIKKDFSIIEELLCDDRFTLLFSRELLDEFLDVVQRPKFHKYFSASSIEIALEIIVDFSEFVNVTTEVELCRDIKDNYLLALAIDGKANYLVTGDFDLLDLKMVDRTKIITISNFIKEFR